MMEKTVVFKKTHSDWHGNYPDDKVRIKYHGNVDYRQQPNETALYRVSAWGTDDFGMYFDTISEPVAEAMFMLLLEKDFIDKKDLDLLEFHVF